MAIEPKRLWCDPLKTLRWDGLKPRFVVSSWFALRYKIEYLPREEEASLEILLIFLLLIGSFAAVGLLVPFSDHILRPIDAVASTDHRDNAQRDRNQRLRHAGGQQSKTLGAGN